MEEDILSSLLQVSQTNTVYETPEWLCIARDNQQNTKDRRDWYAENLEQEKFPHGEDRDHKLDGSTLIAKTNVGDTTEAVTHGEVPTDNFTNEGHVSDEESPADNEEFIDEYPGGTLDNERDKYLTDGDAPTDSSV